jgi:hypothetical protein
MKKLSNKREIALFSIFIFVIFIVVTFGILSTTMRLNSDLNWSNIFETMGIRDLIFSWSGLVYLGGLLAIVVYMIVERRR